MFSLFKSIYNYYFRVRVRGLSKFGGDDLEANLEPRVNGDFELAPVVFFGLKDTIIIHPNRQIDIGYFAHCRPCLVSAMIVTIMFIC